MKLFLSLITLVNQGVELGIDQPEDPTIIPNGIRLDYDENVTPARENQIIFAGSLTKEKGLDKLLKSFLDEESLNKNYTLLIAGKGELESLVTKSSNNGQVVYLGYLDNVKLREKIQSSQLLVVPSKSESFGIVYLEALYYGSSVIGYGPSLLEIKSQLNSPIISSLITTFEFSQTSKDLGTIMQSVLNSRIEPKEDELKEIKKRITEVYSWESICLLTKSYMKSNSEPIFFIFGMPRSGTKLLRDLLNQPSYYLCS